MGLSEGPVTDWTAAVDLIRNSWSGNRETPLDYGIDFVNTLLQYPVDEPVLAPALYDNGRLIAFVVGLPRSVRLQGQPRRLLLLSLFTVDPAYRGLGYGRAVWASCLHRAKAAGYDGTFHYCVDGNPSNAITVAAARQVGFEARHIYTVKYLRRLLRPGGVTAAEPEAVHGRLLLEAAESLAPAQLARVWSVAEAEWQMGSPGRLFAADPNGGVLTGSIMHVADTAHTPCFFLEDVLWDRLAPEARSALLARMLSRASCFATVAILPVLGYAELSPFREAGFRLSPYLLHAYLTLWEPPADAEEFSAMYLDVF